MFGPNKTGPIGLVHSIFISSLPERGEVTRSTPTRRGVTHTVENAAFGLLHLPVLACIEVQRK